MNGHDHYLIDRMSNGHPNAIACRSLALDGLRGLAVILVFFVHYHAAFRHWLIPGSAAFTVSRFLSNIGHTGVDLFFLLSGYLIYSSLIRKRPTYLDYVKRRIRRIYPTFLFVTIVYIAASFVFPHKSKMPQDPDLAALYLFHNVLILPYLLGVEPLITVAWSLSYEFLFYLCIPVLIIVLRLRHWRAPFRFALFMSLAAVYVIYCLAVSAEHVRLIMFIAGILLFEARECVDWRSVAGYGWEVFVLCHAACTLAASFMLTAQGSVLRSWQPIAKNGELFRIILLSVMWCAVVAACCKAKSCWCRVFSFVPIRWLGEMSYSYYLIHALTLNAVALVMMQLFPPNHHRPIMFWLMLPLCFCATLFASTVLFVMVEKRFSLTGAVSARKSTGQQEADLPQLFGVPPCKDHFSVHIAKLDRGEVTHNPV